MNRSLWIAKSGMEGQQFKLDTISNNLANVATNGYKRGGVVFEDLMYDNLRAAGAASSDQTQLPTGLQVGLGTRVSASTRNFSQGNLQQTGNNLDLAVKGQGFFQIQMPDGSTGYSRDGAFQLDATGQIVTANGHVLEPGITVPANAQSVTVAADGTVNVDLARAGRSAIAGATAVGQLHQPGRPGGTWPEPVCRDGGVRRAEQRRARHGRTWQPAAGLCRRQQRQRGRGTGGDDRHAARLRAQLQGDPDDRPDAGATGAAVMRVVKGTLKAAALRRPSLQGGPGQLGAARRWLAVALCGATCAVLGGCVTMNPRVEVAEPTNVIPRTPPPPPAQNNGAIFQVAQYRPLFEDYRARHRGDTLKVEIVEKVVASQKSTSSVDKTGTVEAKVNALAGIKPSALSRLSAEGTSSNSFAGKGATENSNDFFGSITVLVTEVLPNGHLLIAGEKQIGVNSNVDVLRFSGQVDPLLIQAGNSIPSAQIANVRVEHRGRGQQADAQTIGWLSRFFLNILPI